MKNEDRIVELLSESLKRQDQMVEQLSGVKDEVKGMNTRLDKHEDLLNRLVKSVDGLADLVKHSLEKSKRLDAMEERLRKLEKHTGLE